MSLVVQKYGGTSVANTERIKNVAQRVIHRYKKGNQVIVVVSAMSGETNRLVAFGKEIMDPPEGREYDVLVSTGEQVTIALLAMAIQNGGIPAVSYLGHQVRILTDDAFSKARIRAIDSEKIHRDLQAGKIVVVAGFQGVDEKGNLTTLGRGGSDTTAVAIAAALKADACEIYTDVDGVYTTDPNLCTDARKIDRISYEEMLEMASTGAKVLQIRSVELAAKYRVPVEVRSSFNDNPGTWVTKEEKPMESRLVTGVSYQKDEAKIAVRQVPDKPGVAAKIFEAISEANINVDMIVQNVSSEGFTDLTFTVPKSDLKRALVVIEKIAQEIGAKKVETSENIAKLSIIGLGMRSHAGIAGKMFSALAKENINIQMISTSEIKISIIIDEKYTELAVRVLHEVFELGIQ
ncbi:MAG TPA: aspartate kinase [Deltaproteobacteria bacterium]|nr:aspartate kinase [Deltaproteobacteria bacterium]